jgi:DNA-binding transcriptional LysR family regulator
MDLDWDDLGLVAAIRAEGSTAGAARRLGIDQTTAARRLARLEQGLDLTLFDRVERRLVARPVVEAVMPDLDAAASAIGRALARLRDERSSLAGHVVVSTVDLVATRQLAPRLAAFRDAHPGVRLTFDLDDAPVSLAAREADVAVRLARPRADTAIIRRIGTLDFALYAPADTDRPERLPLAAYGERLAHLPESRWLATHLAEVPIRFRADRAALLVEAVVAGHRAVLPCLAADADPRLTRLDVDEPPPSREIWLLVHPERRADRAVSAVVAWIEATIRESRASAVTRGRRPGSPA